MKARLLQFRHKVCIAAAAMPPSAVRATERSLVDGTVDNCKIPTG